jgi:UDP-N-acetyl-D-glucosamine dehydrogenase
MGLGYVGLTEAVEFANAGFAVTGFDVDRSRVNDVQHGRSYLTDVGNEDLAEIVERGRLGATEDFSLLAEMDVILICVPTPLSKTKAPDLSYISAAVTAIARTLRPAQLIVLESTTYPGTTEEVVLPMLLATGLQVGRDFHLCFAPERINPGDKEHPPCQITRVVGGITEECAQLACALYARISRHVMTVSSTQVAEMVKLLENTFRAVNIGLVNELALMCRAFGIDVWEVVEAAATKPFGFIPFYPGPGLGGHCIPIDPLYLSWRARVNGFEPRFIDLAHQVNSSMPRVVISIITDALNVHGRSVNGASLLVLGVTYKRDVNDVRESPAIEIIHELRRRGADIYYHDPYISALDVGGDTMHSAPLDDDLLHGVDCVVIATDHSSIDFKRVVELARLVVDTRNATRGLVHHRERIVRL